MKKGNRTWTVDFEVQRRRHSEQEQAWWCHQSRVCIVNVEFFLLILMSRFVGVNRLFLSPADILISMPNAIDGTSQNSENIGFVFLQNFRTSNSLCGHFLLNTCGHLSLSHLEHQRFSNLVHRGEGATVWTEPDWAGRKSRELGEGPWIKSHNRERDIS